MLLDPNVLPLLTQWQDQANAAEIAQRGIDDCSTTIDQSTKTRDTAIASANATADQLAKFGFTVPPIEASAPTPPSARSARRNSTPANP